MRTCSLSLKSLRKSDLSILSLLARWLVYSRLSALVYFLTGGELAPILSTKPAVLLRTWACEVRDPSAAFERRWNRKENIRMADCEVGAIDGNSLAVVSSGVVSS